MPELNERVSSTNIGAISRQTCLKTSFQNKAIPKYENVVSRIKSDLKQKIRIATETFKNMQDSFSYETERNVDDPFEAKLRDLIHLESELDHYLEKDLPEGFEIVPVLVNPKLDQKKIDTARYEFDNHVRTEFIKHAATNDEDLIRSHGVSQHIVDLMKTGYIMTEAFPMNVDHVSEIANSGNLSIEKEMDPNNKGATRPTTKINHFNNLMLLPEDSVHEFKNVLKNIQTKIYDDDKPRYLLMLMPKADRDGVRHYVAPQQRYHSDYSFNSISDQKIAKNCVRLINSKVKAELEKDETTQVAINIVIEEMQKAVKKAQRPSANKITNQTVLEKTFYNEDVSNLQKKLKKANHPKSKELNHVIEEMLEIVEPDHKKRVIIKKKPKVVRVKKKVVIKTTPS